MEKELIIYTDGAALGNPGKGGYGIVMMWGNARKELSQGFQHTTNNRMELMAVIVALEMIKTPNIIVNIHSDSKYVCDAIEKKMGLGLAEKRMER
jgi:ribonuclease HI